MKLKENDSIKIVTGGEAKVLKELGAGGQGTVYMVNYGGKDYALKWYHKPGKPEFYDNLKHNIEKGSPSPAFLWPALPHGEGQRRMLWLPDGTA